MEVRKMMEDIAKITEARGVQPGAPGVDVIVWIASDVPHAVYLDETYTFRVCHTDTFPSDNQLIVTFPRS